MIIPLSVKGLLVLRSLPLKQEALEWKLSELSKSYSSFIRLYRKGKQIAAFYLYHYRLYPLSPNGCKSSINIISSCLASLR